MSFLLLYIGEGRAFDESLVRGFWAACPGVSALRENAMQGAALDAEFMFGGDRTVIELKEDRETVALSGTGVASVQMSFLLQSIYPEPLHVIDDGYGFDFVIRDYETAQQLADAIYAALGPE